MAADLTGPCADWPVHWTCDLETLNPAVTGIAVSSATEVLWALTGMRFGTCEVTLRPCARDCFDGRFFDDFGPPWTGGRSYPQPALIGGLWFNLTCGGCTSGCSCTDVSEVRLPAPVNRIVEVLIDGTPMATGSYRLDNNRLLVRTDGGQWPRCNDLSLDDTEPGTWSVTAVYGEELPEGAALAMGQLACAIVEAAGNGGECPLPAGVQQLARQGVTIQYPDVGELFRDGRTGLYLVDMFIAAWNPGRLRNRSRVYRVDQPTVRRAGT
ncbi:hypothetical protein QNO07_09270 [Streptomyces sp. 549]|uniref:hypothetical protein n=1 Tax=Streptomyces sp. 549 TaxID=3049076 RepID=UPI0024C30AA0|nr:hypothetical protein [Streptomyces sp. 549]MDK1473608.1 hypothetical protein [Streptomyces sp. 549]